MDPEDVANDELLAGSLRRGHHRLRFGHGRCHRLLEKHVAAGGERLRSVVGMRVGVGVDRDGVGFRGGQGLAVVGKLGVVAAKGVEQVTPRLLAAGDHAHDLEARQRVIGLGVRLPHVAAADDEDPDGRGHGKRVLGGRGGAGR